MATPPVFLVDRLPQQDETVLDGAEGRHAATVRRMRAGEQLLLSDGRGELADCEVITAEQAALRLAVLRRWHQPPPQPRVVLAQALIKGDRGELAVELATEAGVDEIVPWRASRCIARWDDGPRGAKALAKWQAAATQAAKQARRAYVPEVAQPVSTGQLAERTSGAARALVLHESATSALSGQALPDSGDLVLVVGPEGGLTDDELATLAAAGAVPTRLGPSVLRASTAAAVALGAIGVLTSRWLA
jgi:16S rRNA (uracil1498-N3)-methyltransferase